MYNTITASIRYLESTVGSAQPRPGDFGRREFGRTYHEVCKIPILLFQSDLNGRITTALVSNE